MRNRYNLDNLVAGFKHSLENEHCSPITVKNYQSDLRHFIGWALFISESQKVSFEESSPIGFIQFITASLILDYRAYLLSNQTPQKTISRRLSTMRKFCSFCISQGWMKENPCKHITNRFLTEHLEPIDETDRVVAMYRENFLNHLSDVGIRNQQLAHIDEFISIINS